MNIYILPVKEAYQPQRQPFRYPRHSNDFGVEQDFLIYLRRHTELVTRSAHMADWHYLPIFWTRWHLNHHFGKAGLEELQEEVSKVILDDQKTFTICQYDDGPLVKAGATTVFLGSRKLEHGIDIPLLCSPHKQPFFRPSKKYVATFVGRLQSHHIREQLAECVKSRADVFIYDGYRSRRFFVRKILEAYVALCPRGYGGSSFRFYEAMQLGTVPFLIGEVDTRPFKHFINWDECSLYSKHAEDVGRVLDMFTLSDYRVMAEKAAGLWPRLTFQAWCHYVVRELKRIQFGS